MLDAVGCAEFHQEFEDFFEVFDVVVVAFVCFDVAQEDYIVGEIQRVVGSGQNDTCC